MPLTLKLPLEEALVLLNRFASKELAIFYCQILSNKMLLLLTFILSCHEPAIRIADGS